jgi:asparagine synthase (glutamine-hydrolysing)
MCAINGVTSNNRALVMRMNEATKHRGPDGARVYEGEGITLGHNRLAIIDLREVAQQPMHTPDSRYTMVFNGEIYNYRELRNELRDRYTFVTESDSEVLLAAYTVWGEEALSRFRGIFACGIWDAERKELMLVRDQMGVKPLYYTHKHGVLAFSSELQGLLHEGGTLQKEAVALFLELQYVPSGHTFVEGIHKLPPGHMLRYKDGKITITCYFNHLDTGLTPQHTSLYDAIDGGVHRQLVSDRPIGVFLSGGFDSSIVLHHTVLHANERVKTFSIGFDVTGESEKEINKYNADARLAKKTAAHYGTDHHEFILTREQVAESFEDVYGMLDEPVSTSTSLSQYFLNEWVRKQGVVVALGGDGGDELFGGYTRHRALMAAYLFQKLPKSVRRMIGKIHPRGVKLDLPLHTPLHLELMATDPKVIRRTLMHDIETLEVTRNFFDAKYHKANMQMHPLETYMRVDRHTWLADHSLTRSDRTSMVHGVEFRVPLLDLDIVAYADTISPYRKTGVLVGKKIIRDTYQAYLPEHLYREPKRGWLSPGAKWLRYPGMRERVRAILSSEYYNGLDGLFDWKEVRAIFEGHCDGGAYAFHPLWGILILQIWARKHNIRW